MVNKFNGTPNYGLYNGYGPRLRSVLRCTPPGKIVNLGCVYSDRLPMLVPDITDAFVSIFKVMLVTNCVSLVPSPCVFTPHPCPTPLNASLEDSGGLPCIVRHGERSAMSGNLHAASLAVRRCDCGYSGNSGHTAQELPMEDFIPKWMEGPTSLPGLGPHVAGHVRDVLRVRHVHGNPACRVPIRLRANNGHHDGFWFPICDVSRSAVFLISSTWRISLGICT